MKRLVVILVVSVCFLSATTESSREDFVTLRNLNFPEIMYYGANLGYFPPGAREYIMNTAFPKEKMEQPWVTDPFLYVRWSDDNNTVLMEAYYTPAEGYAGAGTVQTLEDKYKYSGSPAIFERYGKYAYYHTLRFKYEYSLYVRNLLENDPVFKEINDPVFAEIIDFAKKLSAEIEYDWANYSGYEGPVKPTPGKRRAVCDGYTEEVMRKALKLPSVLAVQRWRGANHAWNVLILVDGRTLYFDLTWFDNESINEKGEIYQTDDYNWENITFFEHLFRFSNVEYGANEFNHNFGRLEGEEWK